MSSGGENNGGSKSLPLLREPLLHFLSFAALFLLAYQLLAGGKDAPAEVIVVDGKQIEQLQQLLARNLQRAPTEQELKGAIDDYVKEEIYYREAKALGLDQDDTVIRRRLRQKMEFLSDLEAGGAAPTDDDLRAYYAANPRKFAEEPSLAFQQVFVSSDAAGTASAKAQALLRQLQSASAPDPSQLGDGTALPAEMPLTPLTGIAAVFGGDFAEALQPLAPGRWAGPVSSAYGFHLVRITEQKTGRVPELSSIRDAVAREWAYERRQALEAERFAQYLRKYRVSVETGGMNGAP